MSRAMKDSGIIWLGEIPQNWDVIAFWQAIKRMGTGLNPRDNFVLSKDDPFFYVTIRNFKDGKLYLDEECDRISPEAWNVIQERSDLHVGDILFASISKDGQAYIIDSEPENWNINESVFSIRINSQLFDVRYFYYHLTDKGFYDDLRMDATGSTFQSIKQNKLRKSRMVIPPLPEQIRIAAYLDCRCAEIDRVIAATQRTIEEYKKLKQSIITEAVTHGVRGPRKMKDSGIEWIGEIPEEWEIRRIKTLFYLRDEKNYQELETVNLISLYTDLGVVQHSDLEKATGNKASSADGYKKVYEDDIIVNIILCWMGAVGRSAYTGVTSPAYDIYVPYQNVDSRYYHYFFRTSGFSGECYKRGRGIMAMRWRTYSDQFRDIKVVYPNPDEQREIVDFINSKCSYIDNLILAKQQLLTQLESYKKSVIYEYVTGKREVPECQ